MVGTKPDQVELTDIMTADNAQDQSGNGGDQRQAENKEKNFRDVWNEFSQTSGLHAVNKVSAIARSDWRSILWLLAILCMVGFFLNNLVSELRQYYAYPIITTVTIEDKAKIEFPAITICNQCTLNRTRVKQFPYLEEYFFANSLLGLLYPTKHTRDLSLFNVDKPLSREWWRNISMEQSELFKLCFFGGERFPCADSFESVFTSDGLCHTFNYNPNVTRMVDRGGSDMNLIVVYSVNQDEYTFRSSMASGVKVYIHDPRRHPQTTKSIVVAPPGMTTYISVQKAEYNFLPHPYTAFPDSQCVDTQSPHYTNPLEFYPHYSYIHCVMECVEKGARDFCGCVGPADPQNATVCSILKQRCYDEVMLVARKNVSLTEQCRCGRECFYTDYDTRASYSGFPADIWSSAILNMTGSQDREYMRNNLLELRIFYETMTVRKTSQHPQYGDSSIFANVGGQMGLCLGASLLTLVELTEFITCAFICLCHKVRGRGQENKVTNRK